MIGSALMKRSKMKSNIRSSVNMTIERDGQEIDLHIYGEGYYDSGRLSGPPEDCYPPEGEIEITAIESGVGPWKGELTDEEHEEAISLLWDGSVPAEPDYPDYDEDY